MNALHAHLRALLDQSGISATAFARSIGSDRTRIDDWLSGAIAVPNTAREWIQNAIADENSIRTRVGELEVVVRRAGPRRR